MFETLPFSVRQTFRVLTPGFCHPEPDSGSRCFSLRSFSVLFLPSSFLPSLLFLLYFLILLLFSPFSSFLFSLSSFLFLPSPLFSFLLLSSPSSFFLPFSYPLHSFFSTSLFFCSSLRSLPFFFLCPRFSFSLLPCSLFSSFSFSVLFLPSLFLPSSLPLLSSSYSLLFLLLFFFLPCSPYFLLSFFFPLSSLSPLARGMTDWECGAYRRDDGWRERE